MLDVSQMTVRVKTTVKKFNGDEASDPDATPVEVIEREEDVPFSSLPPHLQLEVLKRNTHGSD